MKEYDQLPITPPNRGARKYGKTSFELGQLEGQQELLRVQLADRFGPLSDDVIKRLESYSKTQLLDLANKFYAAKSLRELDLEP